MTDTDSPPSILRSVIFRRTRVWLRGFAGNAPVCVRRLTPAPIIRPDMLPPGEGDNINGPSLIRAPEWLPNRLGNYYLYFGHHRGRHIRLAYADRLEGPWTVYSPGTLRLSETPSCQDHIASPDVHVDEASREIRMYFHGPSVRHAGQMSFVATSADGIRFCPRPEELAIFYLRMLPWRGQWIGMAKGGVMYRSPDGLSAFERLPVAAFPLKDPEGNSPGSVRHVALQILGSTLLVYFTRIGDAPESILRSFIALDAPNDSWVATTPELILRPETSLEGADLPRRPSKAGRAKKRENALRDPAILQEADRVFLLYAVAGESGISVAELVARPGGSAA